MRQGVTLLELMVVLVIIGIFCTMGIGSWQAQMEKEYAQNAKTTLKIVWQAEEVYFSWKNRYTQDWDDLEINNPNNTDKWYEYNIKEVTNTTFIVQAERRGKSGGFTIDQNGTIASF